MNGNTESALVEFARRSHEAAEKAAGHALRADQTVARMERELGEIRRDMRHGFEALNAALLRDADTRQHTAITEEDWEDSPTGNHKRMSKRKWEQWQREREMSADAKRWRKVINTSGKVALGLVLVVLGWLVRHWMGRP